jgi:RNA polymerase sigma-70 factor (ECF subfamily)
VPPDRELLARARVGEAQALEQIHTTYYRSIFRYIAFRVGSPDAAEDLASEVFVRFLQAIQQQRSPNSTVRGWLFAVAANVVSDFHRQHYRAPSVPLDELLVSEDTLPEELAEIHMTNEELRQALLNLTEEQQHVIALRFGHALPFREIAQVLGKSEDAVKKLQARALLTLARRMSPRMTD